MKADNKNQYPICYLLTCWENLLIKAYELYSIGVIWILYELIGRNLFLTVTH